MQPGDVLYVSNADAVELSKAMKMLDNITAPVTSTVSAVRN